MSSEEQDTLNRIHKVATDEFLEKGFQKASLRNIVKLAGVTTGAFYGYYKSKEELFEALVGEVGQTLIDMYRSAHVTFEELSGEEQRLHMGEISSACMGEMLNYAMQYRAEVRLLLRASTGTRFENFLDHMIDMEINATHTYVKRLEGIGIHLKNMNPFMEHIIVSEMLAGFFELVLHEIPKEDAFECLEQLQRFFQAGWAEIMGMDKA